MLSLLWTRLGRRFRFWSKLVIFSSSLHVLCLFLILFSYSVEKTTFHVNINRSILKSGAPIIFVNAQRRKSMQTSAQTNNVSVKKVKIQAEKTEVKKLPAKKQKAKKTQSLKTKIIKKQVKKPAKKQSKPVKKEKKLTNNKKKREHSSTKKNKIKKIQKTKAPMKPEIKQEIKQIKETKKVETVKDAIYIGRQELQALKIEYEIEAEIKKHWRPPAGLSKDLSCMVNVLVDWNGKAKQVKITRSSGVLIYDVSARMAVSRLHLPAILKGKEVNITFNQ